MTGFNVEVHHYFHLPDESEVLQKLNLLMQSVAGIASITAQYGEHIMATETAVERLTREGQETKAAADAAVAGINDLKAQVAASATQIATLTDQLRANATDPAAVNAVADQLDAAQQEITDALAVAPAPTPAPPVAVDPTTSGDASGGGTPAP